MASSRRCRRLARRDTEVCRPTSCWSRWRAQPRHLLGVAQLASADDLVVAGGEDLVGVAVVGVGRQIAGLRAAVGAGLLVAAAVELQVGAHRRLGIAVALLAGLLALRGQGFAAVAIVLGAVAGTALRLLLVLLAALVLLLEILVVLLVGEAEVGDQPARAARVKVSWSSAAAASTSRSSAPLFEDGVAPQLDDPARGARRRRSGDALAQHQGHGLADRHVLLGRDVAVAGRACSGLRARRRGWRPRPACAWRRALRPGPARRRRRRRALPRRRGMRAAWILAS